MPATDAGRAMRAPEPEAGFSLIEALVALTIASLVLLAVLELQTQLSRGQLRYERALDIVSLQRNALALTEDVNPTREPRGARALSAGRSLQWAATPISAPRPALTLQGAEGRFELRLYRLDVVVLDRSGRRLTSLAFDRVGWRSLEREPAPLPPTDGL